MEMMVTFNLKELFSILVAVFVVIGTIFYIPVSPEYSTQYQLQFGYLSQELFFRYGALFLILFGSLLSTERRVKLYSMVGVVVSFMIFGLFQGFDLHIRRSILNLGLGVMLVHTIANKSDNSILKSVGIAFLVVVLINLVF